MDDRELDFVLAQIAPVQLPPDLRQRTLRRFDESNNRRKRMWPFSWKSLITVAAGILLVSLSAFEVTVHGQSGSASYRLPDGNVLLVSDTLAPGSLRALVRSAVWNRQREMSSGELKETWNMWGRQSLSLGYRVTPRRSANGQYDLAFSSYDMRSVDTPAFEVLTSSGDAWIPLAEHKLVNLDHPFEFRVAGTWLVRLTISRGSN